MFFGTVPLAGPDCTWGKIKRPFSNLVNWYLAYSWTCFRRDRPSRSGNDLVLQSFSIQFQLRPVQLSPNWPLSYKYRRTIFWKLDVDSSRKSPEISVYFTGLCDITYVQSSWSGAEMGKLGTRAYKIFLYAPRSVHFVRAIENVTYGP